jgi:sugar lactone lactonase YvrE
LGLKFDHLGNLIVADEHLGLLSFDPFGQVSVLTNAINGPLIGFPDHLDVAENGIIYFSDATQRSHNVWDEFWELKAS